MSILRDASTIIKVASVIITIISVQCYIIITIIKVSSVIITIIKVVSVTLTQHALMNVACSTGCCVFYRMLQRWLSVIYQAIIPVVCHFFLFCTMMAPVLNSTRRMADVEACYGNLCLTKFPQPQI